MLLTLPGYSGTLAAARCTGDRGIAVTMAGGELLDPGRWSRHVMQRVPAPDVFDTDAFFNWLVDFGRRHPGFVLYPTCDELAWLFSARADILGKYYQLYQPGPQAILRLLDKRSLYELCEAAGIGVVPTSFPRTREEALRAGREMVYPLLLKPRTQIMLPGHGKGTIVDRPEDFTGAFDRFVDSTNGTWPPRSAAFMAGVDMPMVHQYLPRAMDGIYSLAGFIGRQEGQVVARASRKILQRPRRMGVGLCFEEMPVEQELLQKVVQLCRSVGYFGVFEAEFIRQDGELKIIDFNPRFYGQMAFEIVRGLPLGYLAWLGATGDEAGLEREIAKARAWQEGRGYAYTDGFFLNLVLCAQAVSGEMSWSEVRRWRRWRRDRDAAGLMVDASAGPKDNLPRAVATARDLWRAVRHPRSFMLTVLEGSTRAAILTSLGLPPEFYS